MPSMRLGALIGAPFACVLAVALAMSFGGSAIAQDASPPAKSEPAPAMPGVNSPAPLQTGDAFGEEVTLPERTIVYLKGHTNWDAAFDTLVDAFKSLNEYLDKQGIKSDGPLMTIYTETDDTGFSFEAAAPIAQAPANPPKGDIAIGKAPSGKALKFVHRGSYDSMDTTYEAITNHLDEKQLEAKDLFVEEYISDPLKTDPDKLVINVFVPVK